MRKVHPKFYKENYSNLIMEYQAEYSGLEQAMKMMETYYKPDLFKGQDIDEFLNSMLMIDGKVSYENIGEVSFDQRNIKASTLITYAADQYIQTMPEIINKIPVLTFAYNPNGSKKNIIQLIQDRAMLIRDNPEIDLQRVDDLYKTIANYKSIAKDEMLELYGYITDEAIEDEFAYDLLQNRLERTDWSQEKISEFMEQTRQDVSKIRQEKGELELKQEQEESIKDEVGDEFRPKTQEQRQSEHDATVRWMNSMHACEQKAEQMPDDAKNRKEATAYIEKARSEQIREQNKKMQEENDKFEQEQGE